MSELRSLLEPHLDPHPLAWLDASADPAVALPGLPRRFGRELLGLERRGLGGCDVDFGAWRACDGAAALLLEDAAADVVLELFAHGDYEERAMLLRTRAVMPIDSATLALLGEAQRTNVQDHVEALVLDSDVVARAADADFARADFNRLLLKVAFVGIPLGRMFGAERHANEELSRMLQDLATEREAACRAVWSDTDRLLGRAPVDGTVARLLGGLEHGDDGRRRAAVEGIRALNRPDLAPLLEERLRREPRASIRAAIEATLGS